MTRPGGTTPRGLPFPGSVNIHADTPNAIRALAEAVDSQLSSLGAGIILDTFTGTARVGADSTGYATGQFTVTFPRIAALQGAVASYGTFLGGPAQPGWISPPGPGNYVPPGGTNTALFNMMDANGWNMPYAFRFSNTDITVCALGWGTPFQ
jgi:hypothetical protein